MRPYQPGQLVSLEIADVVEVDERVTDQAPEVHWTFNLRFKRGRLRGFAVCHQRTALKGRVHWRND
jgi:hypothetical protein